MRVVILFFLAAMLGLILSASLVHLSYPSAPAPDMILVLVIALSLYYHNALGVFGAFLLGLLADFASARYLGPNAAGSVVAFLFVGMIANRVYADKALAVFIITVLSSFVKSGTQLAILDLCLPHFHLPDGVVQIMLGEAVMSGLVAPVMLRALRSRAAVPTAGASGRTQPVSTYRLSSSGG